MEESLTPSPERAWCTGPDQPASPSDTLTLTSLAPSSSAVDTVEAESDTSRRPTAAEDVSGSTGKSVQRVTSTPSTPSTPSTLSTVSMLSRLTSKLLHARSDSAPSAGLRRPEKRRNRRVSDSDAWELRARAARPCRTRDSTRRLTDGWRVGVWAWAAGCSDEGEAAGRGSGRGSGRGVRRAAGEASSGGGALG